MRSEYLLGMLQSAQMAVFTSKDIERLTGKGIEYTSLYISRLVKRHKLIRIEKGKYCMFNTNVYEIASNIIFPSYVSLFAAFGLYNLTTQGLIAIVDVMTTKRHKKIDFGGSMIRFTTIGRKRFFGFQRLQNRMIMAAMPEKAIVDALYLNDPSEAYIFEALERGFKNGVLNADKLMDFAKRMHSKKTLGRLTSLLAEIKTLR